MTGTPASRGFVFPPEWAAHSGTWLSWPRPEGFSFPGGYDAVPGNLARIIGQIEPRETVHINVPNENWERIVRRQLRQHGCLLRGVRFHHIPTNECWCRDHGPAFVVKPPVRRGGKAKAAVVDWGFNAWGGKYTPWDADDAVPTRVAQELGLPVFSPGIVMEGGSVDFNGAGTVLTTESCLLNPNRNRGLSRKRIDQYLKDFYGQKHVVWLGEGIAGDDTDGHVDGLARFVSPTTVVIGVEEDPRDENYKVLREQLRRLRLSRDQAGRPFDVVELPMPGVVERQGQRLPATYMNFYFVNGALLVPTYGNRRNDRRALGILQRLLPDRHVIGINCRAVIWGLGAIHCLTQQQPRW
mgnify:CR=1 FL=1